MHRQIRILHAISRAAMYVVVEQPIAAANLLRSLIITFVFFDSVILLAGAYNHDQDVTRDE